jgi:hypothetical protein
VVDLDEPAPHGATEGAGGHPYTRSVFHNGTASRYPQWRT